VIFVDTNVIIYAVGREHPLRAEAQAFFEESLVSNEALVTSAEVLQELLHAYLRAGRLETLDAALSLARARIPTVWPVEAEDAEGARDLLHVACCSRRNVTRIRTFDRGLAAAFV